MKKIIVIYFTLFHLLAVGCSKSDKDAGQDPPQLTPIKVSELKTAGDRTYLEVDGKPFPILGAQIRLDALINCDKLTIQQIEPYFQRAKELELNCIQVPFWWNLIEQNKDSFNFDIVSSILGLANKYNIKLEVLWFGSNMIGDSFSYLVPRYILTNPDYRLKRDDEGTFWNYYGYRYSLKLDHSGLLERESNALVRLFDYIREWDDSNGNKRPVITAQIHNEPDGFVRWRLHQQNISNRNGTKLSNEQAWNMTLKALDVLGMAVKNSTYKVVTRTNLVSNDELKPYFEGTSISPRDVHQLAGIDFVSFDPYMSTINQIKKEVLAYKSLPKNYPLIAENKGSYSNTPSLMLTAVAIGGGYDIYDLITSKFFIDNTSSDFVDLIDHGIYTWDLKEKPHTNPTRNLLKGLKAASYFVAKTSLENFACFNIKTDNPVNLLTQTVSTTGAMITYTTNNGGIGFGVDCGDFLLLYSTKTAQVHIDNGTVTAIEKGNFQEGTSTFNSTEAVNASQNFSLEANVLYKVNFTSSKNIISTTLINIGS